MNVYLYKNEQPLGPFTTEQLRAKADAGELIRSDPAWVEGWAGWQTVAEVPGFAAPESVVYVQKDGAQRGPFTLEQVKRKFAGGEFEPTALAWMEGWKEWQTPAALPGVLAFVATSLPPDRPQPSAVRPAGAARDGTVDPFYFHIPAWRFALLGICSFNLFVDYWFYRNWRFLNDRDWLHVWPLWRTILWPFFTWRLLKRISFDEETERHATATFSVPVITVGLIATAFCEGQIGRTRDGSMLLIWAAAALTRTLWLLPVQLHINRANRARPAPPQYDRWTVVQILLLLVGLLMWIGLLAILLGAEEPAV